MSLNHRAPHHPTHTNIRSHWIVLGLYTVLSLVLTWPLPARMTTWVPGVAQWAFDESTFLWNVWYFKDAVVDRLASPLHTELVYYPLGLDLVLYTYNFFHALAAQPLMLAFNLPFGSNVTFLFSTILSGYGVYLLVLYLLGANRVSRDRAGAQLAAFGAGLLYAFASNRAVYATLGHYDMTTTQWIPFYALMFLRSIDHRLTTRQRRMAAAWAGFFFALNGLAEMITALFLAIFTLIALIVYFTQRKTQGPLAPLATSKAATPEVATPEITAVEAARPVDPVPAHRPFSLVAGALLVTGVVAFALWSPALIPILVQFLTDDYSLQGWGEAIPLSVDLLGFITPTVLHPIFGETFGGDLVSELRRVQARWQFENVPGFRDVNTVFIGWVSLALAVTGALLFHRRVRLWVWTAIVFGLFCLGPFLQINGRYRFDLDGVDATFPMPYALLHYIPIIKANRAPNRNSVLLMLAIAVLVGLALYWIMQRLRDNPPRIQARNLWLVQPRLWLGALLCGLIVFEHLALPFPLSDARVPPVYAQIAADPNPVSVMHMPLGWRDSFGVFGPERTLLQYYQAEHQKPMLGGNISRAPAFKMDYFRRIPLFHAMTEIQFGHCTEPDNPECIDPAILEQAAAQAEELMYLYNTGYVLLMPPIPERYPYADHWEAAWAYTKATLPLEAAPFYAQNGIEAYRVLQPPGSNAFNVQLGVAGSYPYRGEGWDEVEQDQPHGLDATWATATESRLFVPLRQVDPGTPFRVTIQAHPFAYPGGPPQSVELVANETGLGRQPLGESWTTVEWIVPAGVMQNGLNWLELHWEQSAVPRQVLGGSRQIGTTGIELPIDTNITAFDDGAFIALFDETGAQIDGSAGRMGVNITVLHPTSGEILDMRGFDTTANAFESEALAAFVQTIPSGHPALVASFGDATAFLEESAIGALRSLGADITLDTLARNHFAIIGVKNAEPGSAQAEIHPDGAFVQLSLVRDRRTLAAAVHEVVVRPAE